MAESADAEDRDEITRASAADSQCVEGCHPSAHQRRGILSRQLRGYQCKGRGRGNHIVGVAAIERDARYLRAGLAAEEVAAAAVVAGETMPGMPADSNALTGLPPLRDVRTHGVDYSDHLVPRHARKADAGKRPSFVIVSL